MQSDELFKRIYELWKKEKLLVFDKLVNEMRCSGITVRRRLKKWNAITSYNKNGRYYTLPQIAKFDGNGLWCYQKVGFSENGNLIQTITHLVSSSIAGLYGEDIFKLLQFESYSILSRIMKRSVLRREKRSGKFLYFSFNEEVYNRQICEREKVEELHSVKIIPDSIGVIVLVEFIQNPDLDYTEFATLLNRRGIKVTPFALENFFKHHGILKKTHVSLQF
jgi:hypothetical protein